MSSSPISPDVQVKQDNPKKPRVDFNVSYHQFLSVLTADCMEGLGLKSSHRRVLEGLS